MRALIRLALLLLAVIGPAERAWAAESGTLPHVAERIAAKKGLTIVAFGSSSTEGIGATSPDLSYPSLLPRELTKLLPGQPVAVVLNKGIGGEQIDDMMRRLQQDVLDEHPDLVIWQLGTNDAMQRLPIAHFIDATRDGLRRIQAAGIDVLLMEPQDSPILDTVSNMSKYRDAVRKLGKEFRMPVLKRYDLMLGWLRNLGRVILSGDKLHMSDLGYELLARETAKTIVAESKLAKAEKQ